MTRFATIVVESLRKFRLFMVELLFLCDVALQRKIKVILGIPFPCGRSLTLEVAGTSSFELHDRGLTGSCGCHCRQMKVTQVDVSKFLVLTIGVVGRRSKG